MALPTAGGVAKLTSCGRVNQISVEKQVLREKMVVPPYNVLMIEFGELWVQFANLEYQVSELFAILADPSPMSFGGSLLADEFQLSRQVRLIRALARFRCAGNHGMTNRLLSLCEDIDAVRVTRNQYAHGLWCFEPEKVQNGMISVMDMRWNAHKVETHWSRGEPRDYSIQDLRDLKKKAGTLFRQTSQVCEELRKMDLQPNSEPEDVTQNNTSEGIRQPADGVPKPSM